MWRECTARIRTCSRRSLTKFPQQSGLSCAICIWLCLTAKRCDRQLHHKIALQRPKPRDGSDFSAHSGLPQRGTRGRVMLATAGKAASWQLHSITLNSALIIPPSLCTRLPRSNWLQIYKLHLKYCKNSDVCQGLCACCHSIIIASFLPSCDDYEF